MAWIDLGMALGFWALWLVLRRGGKPLAQVWQDRRVLGARFFAFTMALSLSLQIDPFAARLDDAVGIRNVSWVLGYVFAIGAVYAGIVSVTAVDARATPRWLTGFTFALVGFLIALTPTLAGLPEELHNELPRSLWTLVMREALYVYLLCISSIGFTTFARWQLREKLPGAKLRNWLMLYGFAAGFGFCLFRGTASVIVYANPNWMWYDTATTVSSVMLFSCMTALTLGLAPVSWLRTPVRVILYFKQRIALRDLEILRVRLMRHTGALPWAQPTRTERWFRVPYALYCTLIDILDRRTLLLGEYARAEGAVQDGYPQWFRELEYLPETEDWIVLVRHFQRVARNLDKGYGNG